MNSRQHHYIFAHKALPLLFFDDPDKFVELIENDGDRYLQFRWDHVGKRLEPGARLSSDGLWHEVRYLDDGSIIVLIELPEPVTMPEAYLVAAVLTGDGQVRYFTLEFGMGTIPDEYRTVFCEWSEDSTHSNYGDGPEPAIDPFFEHIIAFLYG